MPTYTMKNIETGEISTMVLSLSEREQLLDSGKYIQQLATPQFVTQAGGTLSRTSSDWKDLLKTIKKGSGRNNTIKV